LAPATRRNYESIRASYELHCTTHNYPQLPVTVKSLTHWLAEIMRKVKPTTAKAYLSALRSLHLQNNRDTSAFDDPRIELVIKGGKRVYGEGTHRIRLPLTSEILTRIIPHIPQDKDGLNLKAALCVGFAGFLRSGEFTWETWNASSSRSHLARKHVKFNPNGSVTLTLPASKTDPYRKGTPIHLSQSKFSPLCPVRALSTLLQTHPGQSDDPLFSRTAGPFNRAFLVDQIKELLLRAGIDPSHYSGHSLRKGAAVSAAARNIARDDIKLLGRWKSDAVDLYINEISEHDQIIKILQLNSRLHTTLSTPSSNLNNSLITKLPWPRRR
jgi:integrase